MTLTDLLARKAKADALPAADREKHAAAYVEVCDQIQGKLIDIAMACEAYTCLFTQNPENAPELIEAARKIADMTGGIP